MHPSLGVTNNNPAVAFQDLDNYYLHFSRSNQPTGMAGTWTTQNVVDNAAVTGEYASLSIINGNPGIAYHDVTNGAPRYVRSTSRSGNNPASWAPLVTVPVTGAAGSYTSLAALASGQPAIAFRNDDAGTVMYAVLY
jgi:hypothetical protein